MPGDFAQDILTRIVNVQWGHLYMMVQSGVTGITFKTDARLLDSYPGPGVTSWLYAIPSGKDILSFDAPGSQSNFGAVYCYVYSTARTPITKLSQVWGLFTFGEEGENALDPDSWREVFIYDENAGTYNVSVHQDMNSVQVDNYGSTFHPYKVTFEPTSNSEEHIPTQPPKLLPLPKAAAMGRG